MDDTPETEGAELPIESDGKRGGIVPMVAALVISLGGGGALGLTVLAPTAGAWMAERPERPPKEKSGGHGGGSEESLLHVVDNLVVNPAASGGSRFLLTSIALEAASQAEAEELAARDVEIRDAFIMVLGSKTVDELTDIRSRPQISKELMEAISTLVGRDVVHRLFIPQFVIQ